MNTVFPSSLALLLRRLPSLALAAALLSSACGSSSTSLVAPTGQKCQISVNGFTGSFGPAGGSGSATIDAARECSWSAASQAQWISLSSPTEGTGTATLQFTVQANAAARARSGALTVNGQQLTVSQEPAPCRFTISPAALTTPAAGGANAVSVTANDGSCAWTAASQSPWIALTSGGSSNGNGSVSFSVATNTGAQRTGTLLVAGQGISVTQDAAAPVPPPSPTPTPTPPPPGPAPAPTPGPPSPPTPTPAPSVPVQLVGDVSGKRDGCPTLSFFVRGIAVITTEDTAFVDVTCNKLKNGTRVRVDGTQQAGRPVVATRVTNLE